MVFRCGLQFNSEISMEHPLSARHGDKNCHLSEGAFSLVGETDALRCRDPPSTKLCRHQAAQILSTCLLPVQASLSFSVKR